ncbi:SDR family oxidoreductase [Sphingobium indicum]|uniref:SDR family oxidoreductase n=1 Tax=Sphingobium indicum TaxID=332055 RepID=A0A4V1WA23_9SPHN|nr:SDR family NAD(P)-dependent oxidoreductase [Sphingobium indicum]NYI23576.1 3-oxoacyl-[acyl-carrier protein] reductase [Sphingobium indicum]RYM01567.1 SDR family oxidoreductase [Sphingobium indicum]
MKDRVAIVTGGANGLGAAIAKGLAGRGARVLVNYAHSRDEAEETVEACRLLGADALAVQGDVGEDADCRRMVAAAAERWGRVDVLVNNAGTTRIVAHADLEGLGSDDFLSIYRTNVVGAFQMIRACTPLMKQGGYGAIVNVSSIAAIAAIGSSIAYAASKAALNNMTVSLARALGPEIRVNAVCPGFIATRRFSDALGEAGMRELIETVEGMTPLRRAGTPEDIATAILFLADEGAQHITGTSLVTDAGQILNPSPSVVSAKD